MFLVLGVTILLHSYDMVVQLNPTLLVPVMVFPLSLAVNKAFGRREAVLHELANFRANLLALYRIYSDWDTTTATATAMGGAHSRARAESSREKLEGMCQLLRNVRRYCIAEKEDDKLEVLRKVQQAFCLMSAWNNEYVTLVPPPVVNAPHFTLNKLVESFENIRVGADYRTPLALRVFNRFSVNLVAMLLSPYFAYLATYKAVTPEGSKLVPGIFKRDDATRDQNGYFAAVCTILLFHCLQNVQKVLEFPFSEEPDSVNTDNYVAEFELGAVTPPYRAVL
eukprot:TRINITY_DN23623_c0_g2_i1.p1 TRINITY_DN23623_c0_g2~~TRINITY_DN23623_c0_g2_i1.p1  ORF type:complete len:281 (+),score=74.63 TRINITY_DN23623_c0_g2_i1:316-1158(+)